MVNICNHFEELIGFSFYGLPVREAIPKIQRIHFPPKGFLAFTLTLLLSQKLWDFWAPLPPIFDKNHFLKF